MLTVVQDADEATGNEAGRRISLAPGGADCGRCGRGHRAAGQRRVDPETDERQRFYSTILPAWARKGQFHHRVIGETPRHTEKSVWMLWSCACTGPIAFVMRGTAQMRAARAA